VNYSFKLIKLNLRLYYKIFKKPLCLNMHKYVAKFFYLRFLKDISMMNINYKPAYKDFVVMFTTQDRSDI